MNKKEAFDLAEYANEWDLWQAACEWQKQKDAEIAVFMKFDEQEEWVNDCEKAINQYLENVKKDILNQGKGEQRE